MSETYHLWTVQLAQWRSAKQQEIFLLDTTAASGVKAFAPTMNNVMLYKEGKLSQHQYTDAYLRRMRDSREQNPDIWKMLLENKRTAFACYCRAGEFCHRHLFILEAKNYLEEQGHTVVMEGEMRKPSTAVPLPKRTQPRKTQEVVVFHGKEDLLSNWNERGFTVKGIYFHTAECFMMYCKAKLMGDHETAKLILAEKDPGQCKILGRQVKPYNDALWNERDKRIMVVGCLQKAREHPDVHAYVLATKGKLIAEASRSDKKWGIGLPKHDPRVHDPSQWLGGNLAGEVWMEVRSILESEIIF